jgi:tetratricopeptide (TPR) repeat protein
MVGLSTTAVICDARRQGSTAPEQATDGAAHPGLPAPSANVLNGTARYHHARAAWAAAEPLYRRALAINEKALGPEHPDLATRLNNLAGLYLATGRYGEAEPLYRRAMAILDKSLPSDHPNLAVVRENYAPVLDELGRREEAAELWAQATAIRQRHEQAQAAPR